MRRTFPFRHPLLIPFLLSSSSPLFCGRFAPVSPGFSELVWQVQKAIRVPTVLQAARGSLIPDLNPSSLIIPEASARRLKTTPVVPQVRSVSGSFLPDLSRFSSLQQLEIGFSETVSAFEAAAPLLQGVHTISGSWSFLRSMPLLSNLTTLEMTTTAQFGFFGPRQPATEEQQDLSAVLPRLPLLRTLLVDIEGVRVLPKIIECSPSLSDFSAQFGNFDSTAPFEILVKANAHSRLRIYSDRYTFWQKRALKSTGPVEAFTSYWSADVQCASLDPNLPFLVPKRGHANSAMDSAVCCGSAKLLPVLFNLGARFDRPLRTIVRREEPAVDMLGRAARGPLKNTTPDVPFLSGLDWGLLELACYRSSPDFFRSFLAHVPKETVVSTSALFAAMASSSPHAILTELLDFAARHGRIDWSAYIMTDAPHYLCSTPFHYAFLEHVKASNTGTKKAPADSLFFTLVAALQAFPAGTGYLKHWINEPAFPDGCTALHVACSSRENGANPDALSLIDFLLSLGAEPLINDRLDRLPVDLYLLNPTAPWNPNLGLSAKDVLSRRSAGEFKHAVFRFARPGLESFLQDIAIEALRAGTAPEFYRDLLRSSKPHPDIIKYMLLGRFDLPLTDLNKISVQELQHGLGASAALLDLAVGSYVDFGSAYKHPPPNDPTLAVLLKLNIPSMQGVDYGVKLFRSLDHSGVSGIQLMILESNGLNLPTGEDATLELLLELGPRSFGVVEFLLGRLALPQRLPVLCMFLPCMECSLSADFLTRLFSLLDPLVKPDAVTPAIADVLCSSLLAQLAHWTFSSSFSKSSDDCTAFWDVVRKLGCLSRIFNLLLPQTSEQALGNLSTLISAASAGTITSIVPPFRVF